MKWKKIFVFYDFAFIFPKIAIKKLKKINSCITEDIYETWFFTCGETQIYPNLAMCHKQRAKNMMTEREPMKYRGDV